MKKRIYKLIEAIDAIFGSFKPERTELRRIVDKHYASAETLLDAVEQTISEPADTYRKNKLLNILVELTDSKSYNIVMAHSDIVDLYQNTKPSEIMISWHTDDVIHRAQERGIIISKHQAKDILETAKKNHDANIGINWEVLDIWTDQEITPDN